MNLAEAVSCRAISPTLGISMMMLHRWRKAAALRGRTAPPLGHLPPPTGRLEELQLENSRLHRLVTDLLLEKIKLEENLAAHHAA